MKRRAKTPKQATKNTSRMDFEELLWVAEHGNVPSIDLHGLSRLAAEHELAQFVYTEQYRHTTIIAVIHGHGTGALKTMVETWIKQHPDLIAYARPSLTSRRSGVIFAILKQ